MKTLNKQSSSEVVPKVKKDRRQFLKLFALGGGAFMLNQMFGKHFNFFSGSDTDKSANKITSLKDFNLVETSDELKLYSKSGEELVTIDSVKSNNS